MNENTFGDSFFFCFDLFAYCFILLSAFLYSKPFRNNYMDYEIIDHYFNIFFEEIQLKKENLKNDFWAPKLVYWSPKQPEYVTAESKE